MWAGLQPDNDFYKGSILSDSNDEINLKDIINFFKVNGKFIAAVAAATFLLSVVYVQLAPRKYEASALLQMARLQNSKVGLKSIESPASLAERLRYPASYSAATLQQCGVVDTEALGEYLGGMLKVRALRPMPDVLEIKVRALTQETAKHCAEAIVQMTGTRQHDLVEAELLGTSENLAHKRQALADELRQLKSIGNAQTGNFGYLAKLDKLSALRTSIDALQEEVSFARRNPAKLSAPIYAPAGPVWPKVRLILFFGLFIGVLFGVLLALAKLAWRRINA